MTNSVMISSMNSMEVAPKVQNVRFGMHKESFSEKMDQKIQKHQKDESKQPVTNGKKIFVKQKDSVITSQEEEKEVDVINDNTLLPEEKTQLLVVNMEKMVAEVVKDILEVSDQELEELLASSGLQLTDLFQVDQLKVFLMEKHGTKDLTEFLTNEELCGELKHLVDGLGELELLKEETQVTEFVLPDAPLVNEMNLQHVETKTLSEEQRTNGLDSGEKLDMSTQKISVETERPLKQEQQDGNQKDSSNQDRDALNLFAQNLTKAVENQPEFRENYSVKVQQMNEIVDQVIEKIKISLKPESTKMEILLNPEELGKVNLSVVTTAGKLTATFMVQNYMAKEALESQMQLLRENLDNQGLKVEAIEVAVSNFSFEQSNHTFEEGQQQKGTSQRKIRMEDLEFTKETLSEEELLAANVMEQNGGSVDFTA